MNGSFIAGAILAGGQSKRFGQSDKCLSELGDKTLLAHVFTRLSQQVDVCLINANSDASEFSSFGIPIVKDVLPGYLGPLAGVVSSMKWVLNQAPDITRLVTCPCDTPFLPLDLIRKLVSAREVTGAQIAMAKSGGRVHPTVALWPVFLAAQLEYDLLEGRVFKMQTWAESFSVTYVDFSCSSHDPFFNINTQDDLASAAHLFSQTAAT